MTDLSINRLQMQESCRRNSRRQKSELGEFINSRPTSRYFLRGFYPSVRFSHQTGCIAAKNSAWRSPQNSEQFITTRLRQVSLRQMTLHFSCTAIVPHTGHLTSLS